MSKAGISLLAKQKYGKPFRWNPKPEQCAHFFNHGGFMGDSPMPTCLICGTSNPTHYV